MSLPPLNAPPPSSSLNPNTSFVTRSASQLFLGSSPYVIAGPNIYWLGLDENDPPSTVAYPSRQRVLEILATAYAMGANTVRSTTLGVSVGCELCVWPSLGVINGAALEKIDFAVWAARLYGLRLVIPLVDNYEYYHGGIYSFLQFHNLSIDDYGPFYDPTSQVYNSFLSYVTTIMNHTNPYTGLRLSQDPTILAWESGNELGGWGGSGAPASWTAALAAFVKNDLGAKGLFVDGSYGVVGDALGIEEVDMYSNHYYPPYVSKLNHDASAVLGAGKLLLAGEFDWVSHGSSPRMWALVAAPALLALLVLVLPRSWFPWPIRYGGCMCCCGGRRPWRRKGRAGAGGSVLGAGGVVEEHEVDGYVSEQSGELDSAPGHGPLGTLGSAAGAAAALVVDVPPSSPARPKYPARPTYKRQDTERMERWKLFEDAYGPGDPPPPGLERIGTGTGLALPAYSSPPSSPPPLEGGERRSHSRNNTQLSMSTKGRPGYTPSTSYTGHTASFSQSQGHSGYANSLARTPSLPPSTHLTLKSSPPRKPKSRRRPPPLVKEPHTFYYQKWHFSLSIFLLLTPAGALLLHFLLPSTIAAFTDSLASTPGVAGGMYWSLFGHTDNCQSYVYHDDGYWLVYPGQSPFMSFRVGQLVPWERGVSGYGVQAWGVDGQPGVACRQQVDLSVLPNATRQP